jgi:hypothetical protein
MTDASTLVPVTDDFLFQTIAPSVQTTDEFCQIPTTLLENFTTGEFQNTKAIQWMHEVPPRFGKPNSVLLYIAGNEEQQTGEWRRCSKFVLNSNQNYGFVGSLCHCPYISCFAT